MADGVRGRRVPPIRHFWCSRQLREKRLWTQRLLHLATIAVAGVVAPLLTKIAIGLMGRRAIAHATRHRIRSLRFAAYFFFVRINLLFIGFNNANMFQFNATNCDQKNK